MTQVSVIIPVYNVAAHLEQCLDSVAGQTLADIEIICVDDGSTDESPVILARYAARDKRFQVVTQDNAGPGAARNTGLALSKGEFVIFLDSDDWFEPDFLEKMIRRAQKTGADVTICRAVEFETDSGRERPSAWMLKTRYLPGGTFTPGEIAEHIFQFTYGWPWDKLYRTEYVRRAGLEYPPMPNSEDLVFVFQSLAVAARITVIPDVLVHHRVNRLNSVSNSRHKSPDIPYQSLVLLKQRLERRGAYLDYERSFLNWAMEFLVWNAANMPDRRSQKAYFQKLKHEWLPEMRFEVHSRAYYENWFTYCKYSLAKYTPWPVFFGVLTAYKVVKEKLIHC